MSLAPIQHEFRSTQNLFLNRPRSPYNVALSFTLPPPKLSAPDGEFRGTYTNFGTKLRQRTGRTRIVYGISSLRLSDSIVTTDFE